MRSWILVLTIVLGSTLRAAAQDAPISADEARRRALAVLRDGTFPIRSDLSPRDVARLEVSEWEPDGVHGAQLAVRLPAGDGVRGCVVLVERTTGLVTYVYQPGAALVVDDRGPGGTRRGAADLSEEVAARATYRPAELREAARRALVQLVPDFACRRFELVEERRDDGSAGPVACQGFVFAEAPAPGVLACYSNLARVQLNPETGELVSARVTQVRFEVREPPPVTAAAAERAARQALGTPARAAAEARLWVTLDEPRRPRPVWVVRVGERAAAVCARDATVLLAR